MQGDKGTSLSVTFYDAAIYGNCFMSAREDERHVMTRNGTTHRSLLCVSSGGSGKTGMPLFAAKPLPFKAGPGKASLTGAALPEEGTSWHNDCFIIECTVKIIIGK